MEMNVMLTPTVLNGNEGNDILPGRAGHLTHEKVGAGETARRMTA